jgi:26S proteasome regulatory subunit N10
MPLESCMILLDNSQYMRNGDYIPNRLAAQTDAANLLITHKTQSNPESTVGVIAMNGGCYTNDGVELLVSPTDDVGKLLGALNHIPIQGKVLTSDDASATDIPASVQVASLALKHRRNKNGQQRIVIFVGSPLTHVDKKALIKAGKGLKKNNVAIDVVAMGELEENEEKLKELVNAANGSGGEQTCHLVTIPEGSLPSDILIGTPVVHGGDVPMGGGMGSSAGAGGGNDFAEYGGVDPNLDPELAMVLRISMEEERARQERIAREEAAARGDAAGESATGGDEPSSGNDKEDVKMEEAPSFGMDLGDEDAQLAQALAMSMAESQPVEDHVPIGRDDNGEDEDDEMAMALALSMANQTEEAQETEKEEQKFEDPAFVQQLMESMPGVDQNDPAIQEALKNLETANQEKKDGDDTKGNDDKKE